MASRTSLTEARFTPKSVLPLALLFILGLFAAACSPGPVEAPGFGSSGTPVASLALVQEASTPTRTANPSPTVTPAPTSSPGTTPTSPARLSTRTARACSEQAGRMKIGLHLDTDLLPHPLDYRVYLPPCYDQLKDQRYPVLYLIHGQSFNDDQWDRLEMDETADRLIATGEISPLILVMPRDRTWTQPTEDRFGQAVMEVLVPWIDENYRTRSERDYRAVGGLSRGAGWALHLGLSEWESFGVIGMHSLPVFWTDLPDIRTWLDSIPPVAMPRIYIDAPDKDRLQIARSTGWFEGLLTENGIPHEWHLFPGYHDEEYWGAHVEDYLRWYAREW